MNRALKVLLLLLLIPFILNAQERLDGIAAIVGDEIVLHSEVNQFATNVALQNDIDIQKEQEKFNKLRKESLDNLIVQKILLAKAREDTIQVDETQVEQVLNNQIQQWTQMLGSESKIEDYFGMPVKKIKRQFRDEVRERLMVQMLQQQYFQNISISRPEVEKFYRTMKDSLPEAKDMVNISHILCEIHAGGEKREEAMKKILSIRKGIKNGEDFAKLAKQYSEDPNSAKNGGELGFIERGDFVRDFEEVAFQLEPGEISDVVETKFGLHLIKLIERRGEKINVRHILIRLQPSSDDAEYTREHIDTIRDSCIQGADFEEMAKKHSDDATTAEDGGNLGWFEMDQLQIQEFKQAVQNLEIGEISEPFRTEYGFHIIKLNDKKQGGALTLDDNWQQIEQMALNYKQNKELQEWVEELRKDIYVKIKE